MRIRKAPILVMGFVIVFSGAVGVAIPFIDKAVNNEEPLNKAFRLYGGCVHEKLEFLNKEGLLEETHQEISERCREYAGLGWEVREVRNEAGRIVFREKDAYAY